MPFRPLQSFSLYSVNQALKSLYNSIRGLSNQVTAGGGGGSASYLVYTALLTQSGTDAPVATVLENTLGGTVVWTRDAQGFFAGSLTGAFALNKTVCFSEINLAEQIGTEQISSLGRLGNNEVNLIVKDNTFTNIDGFVAMSVEIRVYS